MIRRETLYTADDGRTALLLTDERGDFQIERTDGARSPLTDWSRAPSRRLVSR